MSVLQTAEECLGTVATYVVAVVQALTLRLYYWYAGGPAGPD